MIDPPTAQLLPEQRRGDDASQRPGAPAITVVLPIHNHRAVIAARYAELKAALDGQSYEILAVDDGSTDGSFVVLRELAAQDLSLRVVRLRRAFGQTAALAAGFAGARGAVIVTLDAEGQTDPLDISRLLAQLDLGFDIVSGRRDGQQPLVISAANRLISMATGVYLHDYGCPLKVYRADVVKDMSLYGDLYRFIPAIASWQGIQIAEVTVRGRQGAGGRTGIRFGRAINVLLDLITVRFLLNYAIRPMHSFGLVGGALLFLAGLFGSYLAVVKIGMGEDIGSRPLLLLTALLGLVGIQFLVLGLLAELTVRVYYEIQRKPIYAIRETVEAADDKLTR
jgi:glycosyltransferase involved in cell wall biosynthesis